MITGSRYFVGFFLSIKPKPIFTAEGGTSPIYRRPEGIIIGDGGNFGIKVDRATRSLINGFIGDGYQDVSEVIGEFERFQA
jgi:hypothetical protein